MPGFWPDSVIGAHEGVVWFACDVELPNGWEKAGATLFLGAVDNEDTTWVNGVRVGSIDAMAGPDHWSMEREHPVREGVLRAGRNRVVVRVIDYGGQGGFYGGHNGLCFQNAAGQRVSLPGVWRYRVGSRLIASRIAYPPGWSGYVDSGSPGALFGGMIAPIVPAAIAGIWWYQGESNVGEGVAYRELMRTLVQDWRRLFRPDADADPIPFYWVQLASYLHPASEPAPSAWALVREAQTKALSLPATGQAVILDCGDACDIHPKNKRDPGERLAALVRAARGEKVAVAGPRFGKLSVEGKTLRIEFECTGRLRTVDGKVPGHIAISGADRKWRWAESRLDGNSVVAWNAEIAEPVAVRYAWADNPAAANLTDETGLPAWPFRTDDWDDA